MLNIPNLANVNSYRDLSFKQVGELKQLSAYFSAPGFDIRDESDDNQADIYALRDKVKIIDKSLKQKRSFGRWFLDLITFQFIKRNMLNHALPSIKSTIKTCAEEIFNDPSFNPDSPVTDKIDLTQRAYSVFCAKRDADLVAKEADEGWVSTAIEVNDYFQDLITRLNAGEDRPLPLWFHATRNGVDAIAKSSVLLQANAPYGRGVYVSTQDEHYNFYGDYTYAIDPSIVYDKPGAYYEGNAQSRPAEENPGNSSYNSTWVRVEQNVDISGATVAYIATPDEKTRDTLKSKFWGNGDNWNDTTRFYAEVITRKASDWIRQSFRATGYTYELPSNWRKHESAGGIAHIKYVQEPQ